MESYNSHSGDNNESDPLQSMFARLQAARNTQAQDQNSVARELFQRFNHHQDTPLSYYEQSTTDSPLAVHAALDDFPPPAPTPPGNFGHTHQPSGALGAFGPIGTMASNSNASAAHGANLLNLLKFKDSQSHGSQANSQASPSNMAQGPSSSFNHSIGAPFTNNQAPPTIHAPVPMPADPQGRLAAFMEGRNVQHEGPSLRAEPQHATHHEQHGSWNAGPNQATTQMLMNLLRTKPEQTEQVPADEPYQTQPSNYGSAADQYALKPMFTQRAPSHEATPPSYGFGAKEHAESPSAKFNYGSPASQHTQQSYHEGTRQSTQFDYRNPFDAFASSASGAQDSKTSTPGTSAVAHPIELPAMHAVKLVQKTPSVTSSPGNVPNKQLSSHQSPIATPEHARNKIISPSGTDIIADAPNAESTPARRVHGKKKETGSDAMSDLGKANIEAQEALVHAETESAQDKIAAELQEMMHAETAAEFQESAEAAAKDIQKELEKEENAGVLESQYTPEVAQAIREIVDDAAHGPVADSWESAEADEIVVIEETPSPVKVYNFPMKPWISITMQHTEETRPEFRDEVVLDIARLKKEFDQVDRNLVSSTASYIAYGMSKAGGLRVIRQEDGKDAKLFTDTKDRVFNVAVSTSSSDALITPAECIIGTGINGTVYYVQIKSGDKDRLEDPHLEQYGFALPPNNTQEGDAPGGVLKTRARTSSTHPEFFAVGRGKTINIIWPSFIMQKNIFRPGHDRVVDTEKLSKECSLHINTGKAGKDFTFSQDDTTIVSLDKSGRVKFWDVRDLTTPDENSDIRFPMPAHTSLEVKESLMTLNTTPEGEKAWPTSVLLLDKQRPYQKRCALRYMIVGMKQNHTLQLWDLALGKPVQEFNLPHAKESDAVCSVMYHAPTGMIVVGHPTRNSIYFLHLSAPKYSIKGLSQVDYIQKLVAKDSSIPEPDSTAVISGVREYSLANKGILRSLDILVSPPPTDESEPSLFDLYAVHSKGVTSINIKQTELGWTRDNKVIHGVDASEAGLVKIAKLKELPTAVISEPPAVEEPSLPIRIAPRSGQKETSPARARGLSSGPESSRKGAENIPPTQRSERKDTDNPITPVNHLEKSEKKARKKREKAAAAAAAAEKLAAENTLSNGTADPVASGKNADMKSGASSSLSPIMPTESIHSAVKQISSGLGDKLTGLMANEFRDFRGQIDTEFRSRDDAFTKGQQDLLERVSIVLDNNVQAVLARTINDQFDEIVIPNLSALIVKTVENQIDAKIGGKVSHSIQNQMQKTLPNALNQALQRSDWAKSVSDKVAESVALDMEESFQETLLKNITPAFSDMAIAAARNVVEEVEQRTSDRIRGFEQQHLADNHKIDQLTGLVAKLSVTIDTMAANQAQLQNGFLKLQEQITRDRYPESAAHTRQPANNAHSQGPSHGNVSHGLSHNSPVVHSDNQVVLRGHSDEDMELQDQIYRIATLLDQGAIEAGLIQWLHSPMKHEIFEQYLAQHSPTMVESMPPLVTLSVTLAVSERYNSPSLEKRVSWVETAIYYFAHRHLENPATRERDFLAVVPTTMTTLRQRTETLYASISNRDPHANLLQHLAVIMRSITHIHDWAMKLQNN
ncbi:hypothetical protein F5Y15DRAFT_413814 [Xylariaceae sp. FL0016]|nr:hypothetical protein F5Y15DRAFT_413814 [Xylariaceae sp. FL0016]